MLPVTETHGLWMQTAYRVRVGFSIVNPVINEKKEKDEDH